MHSSLVRVQNVFGFFTTVAFTIASLTALSVLFFPHNPSASIAIRNIQVVKGRANPYAVKKEEYAHIKFDLDADLTSLFTWNTKQVFIYITASYPSHYNTTSQTPSPPTTAVIWDRIISAPSTPYSTLSLPFSKTSATLTKQKKTKQAKGKSSALGGADTTIPPHPGSLALKNVRPKYQIGDPSGVLGERGNATLEFGWNVQPWVGALLWTRTQSVGRWQGLQGGRSEVFTFPEVKGKKKATAAAAAAESGGAQAGT